MARVLAWRENLPLDIFGPRRKIKKEALGGKKGEQSRGTKRSRPRKKFSPSRFRPLGGSTKAVEIALLRQKQSKS